jgi:hypothetical protein
MRIVTIGLTMIVIACNWQAAAAETDPGEPNLYNIRQTSPSTGTNIRRPIVLAGAIPLKAHYADLSAEQKNILKSRYEHMKEADEPPFPVDGLMSIYTVVRDAHEQAGLQYPGPLEVVVQVDDHGKATGFSVLRSPDSEITAAVTHALMADAYKPAVCNGSPCAMPFAFHAVLITPGDDTARSSPTLHLDVAHH